MLGDAVPLFPGDDPAEMLLTNARPRPGSPTWQAGTPLVRSRATCPCHVAAGPPRHQSSSVWWERAFTALPTLPKLAAASYSIWDAGRDAG